MKEIFKSWKQTKDCIEDSKTNNVSAMECLRSANLEIRISCWISKRIYPLKCSKKKLAGWYGRWTSKNANLLSIIGQNANFFVSVSSDFAFCNLEVNFPRTQHFLHLMSNPTSCSIYYHSHSLRFFPYSKRRCNNATDPLKTNKNCFHKSNMLPWIQFYASEWSIDRWTSIAHAGTVWTFVVPQSRWTASS